MFNSSSSNGQSLFVKHEAKINEKCYEFIILPFLRKESNKSFTITRFQISESKTQNSCQNEKSDSHFLSSAVIYKAESSLIYKHMSNYVKQLVPF